MTTRIFFVVGCCIYIKSENWRFSATILYFMKFNLRMIDGKL